MSVVTQDVARFAVDDPEVLVAATFACPVCLRAACRVLLADGAELPVARCTCEHCACVWTLAVDAPQLLRLSLDPPATVTLEWGAQARQHQGLWPFDNEDLDA